MPKIINTVAELNSYMENIIIPIVLKKVGEGVAQIMSKHLGESGITMSLSEIIDMEWSNGGKTLDIFVSESMLPSDTGDYSNSGGFRKFMSIDGSLGYNGKTIAWWLASWIDSGVSGGGTYIGNQPIMAKHWFKKAVQEIKQVMDRMISMALKSQGIRATKLRG